MDRDPDQDPAPHPDIMQDDTAAVAAAQMACGWKEQLGAGGASVAGESGCCLVNVSWEGEEEEERLCAFTVFQGANWNNDASTNNNKSGEKML